MQSLVLVCASGLAAEVAATLQDSDEYKAIGVLDDAGDTGRRDVGALPVTGVIDDAVQYPDAKFVVCAGAGATRAAIVARLHGHGVETGRYATVVASDVRVPGGCHIGEGSIVLAGSVFTADVTIGRHTVVMPRVVCTHDNYVSDYATLCAGVTLGGAVHIGERAYVGMNASVRQHLQVGPGSTLGMGSVLLNDLPANAVWAGNPARRLDSKE